VGGEGRQLFFREKTQIINRERMKEVENCFSSSPNCCKQELLIGPEIVGHMSTKQGTCKLANCSLK
jgi:hypothetical protein